MRRGGAKATRDPRARRTSSARRTAATSAPERDLDATLARLARQVADPDAGLHASLRLLTRSVASALGVPRVNVWVFGSDRDRLHCLDAFEQGVGHSKMGDLLARLYPSYFRALEELRTIDAFDARHDPRTRELRESYLEPNHVTSFLDAPILLAGRVEGVVCHEETAASREWTADERAFAAAVADLVSLSLETDRRRRLERALQEREEQYRFLLETAQAVVWRGDPDAGRIRFVSREAGALLGYPAERWTAEPGFLRAHVHPADREWATADGEAPREFRMLAADGRVVWVRNIVRAVRDAAGRALEGVGVMIDVSERRAAEEELRQSREQLRDLSAHVEWAREEERANIARSIHDDLGQALTALKFELSALRAAVGAGAPAGDLVAGIDQMTALVTGTVDHVRRIAKELRPGLLDDLGLVAALEWQVQEFSDTTRIPCAFHALAGELRLPRPLSTTFFRTAQEALTNVARHAQARRAEVRLLRQGARLLLEVEDDGRGIGAEELRSARSLGLLGMKERARRLGGDVSIEGHPGRGTKVALAVPLPAAGPETP